MINWNTYKRAALEYSRMRPRVVRTTITPTANSSSVALPIDALHVMWVDYGEELLFLEEYEPLVQGWLCTDTELLLFPAPSTDDPIKIVYYARHLPDETSHTFPTIPTNHLPYVDDLELALHLEQQADEMAQGPLRYSIGLTDISREKSPEVLKTRAMILRKRVADQLDEPVGLWR